MKLILVLVLLSVLLPCGCTSRQMPRHTSAGAGRCPVGFSKNAWDEDVSRKDELDRSGTVVVGMHVVLRVPEGSVDEAALRATLAEMDRGVAALKQFVGRANWNVAGDTRVYYYFPDGQFVSHAPGGNCVFIPLWRLKERESPWLHECVHLLLASEGGDWLSGDPEYAQQHMPLWLIEGLADAVAMEVAHREKITYFSPLMKASLDTIDSVALKALQEGPADAVLGSVGSHGKPEQLFGPDRMKFAVPFYSASASLVRFIAKQHGYRVLFDAVRRYDRELETLDAKIGTPVSTMRSRWLSTIGYERK